MVSFHWLRTSWHTSIARESFEKLHMKFPGAFEVKVKLPDQGDVPETLLDVSWEVSKFKSSTKDFLANQNWDRFRT